MSGHIRIHLRVRPSKRPWRGLLLNQDDNTVDLHISKKKAGEYVNNQKQNYKYRFDSLLGMQIKQQGVFNQVAKDIIDSVMQGYNGTIFAYGQTGSGKTFTITGGAQRYADRGLIPRSISYIFSQIRRKTDSNYKVTISYLQIYNDSGYDLLDENHSTKQLSDLPKVYPRQDAQGNTELYNLSLHRADTEEDALNLLFIGDTNRVVAQTPKNDASTRSHCIFTIMVEAQKLGSDVKTQSKLSLVDLSGSERIGKTGVQGILRREALCINSTLHFLEQVIIELQKKSQGQNIFISYRNSLMTRVLRDSLGGNCKTSMIATISAQQGDIDQSISTCNFSQRVACIKNQAQKNQHLDPSLIIERLKQQVQELQAQVKLLRGDNSDKTHLSPEQSEQCKQMVQQYLSNRDPAAKLILSDMLKINECFYHMKHLFNTRQASSSDQSRPMASVTNEQVQRLRLLVQQRDNQIAILLNHLNKKGDPPKSPLLKSTEQSKISDSPLRRSTEQNRARLEQRDQRTADTRQSYSTNMTLSIQQLQDRNRAFDIFRKSYRRNQAMEQNKQLLKQRIGLAKNLTQTINFARSKIEDIKNQIQQLRKANALQGLVDGSNIPIQHPRQESLRNQLQEHKLNYREGVQQLRDLKSEIQRIQRMLENSRKRMQADFESWLQVMVQQAGQTRDTQVEDNLSAFYKARDEIYNKINQSVQKKEKSDFSK